MQSHAYAYGTIEASPEPWFEGSQREEILGDQRKSQVVLICSRTDRDRDLILQSRFGRFVACNARASFAGHLRLHDTLATRAISDAQVMVSQMFKGQNMPQHCGEVDQI